MAPALPFDTAIETGAAGIVAVSSRGPFGAAGTGHRATWAGALCASAVFAAGVIALALLGTRGAGRRPASE